MAEPQLLISKVRAYVEDYMSLFDGSHDFSHIRRVLGLSHLLFSQITKGTATRDQSSSETTKPKLDLTVITLSALLHDVGDKKYLKEGQDDKSLVRDLLIDFGADKELAMKVQAICLGVSYSSEILDLSRVKGLIEEHPELAVVQDADRLDAIGAIGVGRVFTYGGAKTRREMDHSMHIFDEKLLKLQGMMKTEPGRHLAHERTERLRNFQRWWNEEVRVGELALSVLKPVMEGQDVEINGSAA